ncbi:MAG TPA: lamin tail domain-containing protein, partial [Bacteroidia bacterium]|nr:lamin tail domain-containing protein [Bacteroidia bacterium]
SNPMYKRMYLAHVRTIVNEMLVSNYYQTKASQMMALIDTAVVADTNKFYSYAQYQASMNTNVANGSFSIPGITTLIDGRIAYLQSVPDFTNIPPSIIDVKPSDTIPVLNSPIAITANVSNTNAVYVGYRFLNTDKFVRVQMKDDGLNNDGAAGDNVYGTILNMSATEMQYYIYAENASAGLFSPQRAEHEFYILKSGTHTADSGQVVINEFLASNKTGMMNEKGKYEDWIELYNTTSLPLNLDGLHLSDTYANASKYTFPANTTIAAHGYLLLWADENATTTSYLHCNFKLSASGEQLILTNANGKIMDSLSFGAQGDDISYARCPDGTGNFSAALPTFNASNCANGIHEEDQQLPIAVFPNPANAAVTVEFNNTKQQNRITVLNMVGQEVLSVRSVNKSETIYTADLPVGLYFIRVNESQFRKMEIVR